MCSKIDGRESISTSISISTSTSTSTSTSIRISIGVDDGRWTYIVEPLAAIVIIGRNYKLVVLHVPEEQKQRNILYCHSKSKVEIRVRLIIIRSVESTVDIKVSSHHHK